MITPAELKALSDAADKEPGEGLYYNYDYHLRLTKFHNTLVNAYRAGDLVHRSELANLRAALTGDA